MQKNLEVGGWRLIFALMEEKQNIVPPPSEQDKSIIVMLKDGMTAKAIAEKLSINENTLAFSLKVLRSRYGCSTTTQLVAHFMENNLFD